MSLAETYEGVLRGYLAHYSENELLNAYNIGKEFQAALISPDELIGIHFEAIERLSHGFDGKAQTQAVLASFSVLIETMIAYGIAYLEGEERERREIQHKEQIAQLLEVDKLKDQFLGILSHELRTPINAIMGFASVLEDGIVGELTPPQQPLVHKILGSSEVLLALVNDLLDMSSVQAGKFGLSVEAMAAGELIQAAIGNAEGLASLKHISIIDEVPADLPRVVADRQRIGQVVTNLLSNAIKFTPTGGSIVVRSRVERNTLLVEVEDTGIGIAQADHEKIFTKFIQVDMSNSRPHGGTGLGLSISKALIEAHGGAIGVHSSPANGSTFWFTVPLPAPETRLPADEACLPGEAHG